jgi:hypothetical protein
MSLVTRIVVVGALLMSCASADKGQPPPHATRELAAGAARIRGGGVRMDVQVGRALTARPAKAGSIVVTPHAVVTP